LEYLETAVFDPKTPVFDPKTGLHPNVFPKFFWQNFCKFEKTVFFEKFPNFKNQRIPKLAKMKSSENSFFLRALPPIFVCKKNTKKLYVVKSFN
jgi:hypothetical protein